MTRAKTARLFLSLSLIGPALTGVLITSASLRSGLESTFGAMVATGVTCGNWNSLQLGVLITTSLCLLAAIHTSRISTTSAIGLTVLLVWSAHETQLAIWRNTFQSQIAGICRVGLVSGDSADSRAREGGHFGGGVPLDGFETLPISEQELDG